MPQLLMPTRDQLKKTYTSIMQSEFDNGTLKQQQPPKDIEKKGSKFRTSIRGMAGNETVIQYGNDLFLRNTKDRKTTYYYGGPAPQF